MVRIARFLFLGIGASLLDLRTSSSSLCLINTSCNQLIGGLIDRRNKTCPHCQLIRFLEVQIISYLSQDCIGIHEFMVFESKEIMIAIFNDEDDVIP